MGSTNLTGITSAPAAAVTPSEVASNPLVSGLNSPAFGQTMTKVLILVLGVVGSLLGFKAASPALASILPDVVYQVAGVIAALGTPLAAASAGWRQKIDPATVQAVKAAEAAPVDAPKFL